MKSILLPFMCMLLLSNANSQLPKVSSGSICRVEKFPSKFVDARTIDIWLPDGYSTKKKYAVLYMHDGNSLFDSTIMWNHQEWGVDETIAKLLNQGKMRDVIVVGIWNNGEKRHAEYFPQQPYESLAENEKHLISQQLKQKGRADSVFKPVSDNYLKFLVQELKPYVDSAFSTHKERENTFVAGSSMGGLISLYAICEYPQVFGGAACLSTHWPGTFMSENNPIPAAFIKYLQQKLPAPKSHKIYFDHGDQTLDAMYPPLQKKVDELMLAKRFNASNWQTKFFAGEDHSERAWAKRLEIPLLFLLKK